MHVSLCCCASPTDNRYQWSFNVPSEHLYFFLNKQMIPAQSKVYSMSCVTNIQVVKMMEYSGIDIPKTNSVSLSIQCQVKMQRRALHLHLVFWQHCRAKTLIPNPMWTKGDRNKTANPVLSGQSAEYPEPQLVLSNVRIFHFSLFHINWRAMILNSWSDMIKKLLLFSTSATVSFMNH